jgi:hypothetical protein
MRNCMGECDTFWWHASALGHWTSYVSRLLATYDSSNAVLTDVSESFCLSRQGLTFQGAMHPKMFLPLQSCELRGSYGVPSYNGDAFKAVNQEFKLVSYFS